MKANQNAVAVLLAVLLGAAAYGVYTTSGALAPPAPSAADSSVGSTISAAQNSLAAVRELLALPTSQDEVPVAQEVLRLADQDMDLAFAEAVRDAAAHPQPMSKQAQAIDARLQRVQKELADDQALVTQLTAAVTKANGTDRALDDQLDLAKARLELDTDEGDDAKQDLIRAGGDPKGRLQTMVEEHEAASKASDSTRVKVTAAVEASGLIHRAQAYSDLQRKQVQIQAARAAAESASVAFASRHAALDAQAAREKADTSITHTGAAAPASLLLDTQRRALEQKARSTLEQRGDNQHKLAAAYGRWARTIHMQQRVVVNGALQGLMLVLGIALIGLFFDRWVGHVLARLRMERRAMQRLHAVIRVSVQVLGVILILIMIFGVPSNLGTIIGLAGAGLTVALKDFIVAFVGWLVLMGRDGVRIADLVEINGVTGEVVELGMFNTVLLETGNWTDAGHPTGRRVTFTNSYAIEGHYFNFSTSGQWLWDEVRIVVPSGTDPTPVVAALQKHVEEATADSARVAEQEWRGATRSPVLSAITAAPAITIKPIMGGVEITLRYITHAAERYQLRSKLYLTAVGVLGSTRLAASAPVESSSSGA